MPIEPLVSIITPSFNRLDFIDKCILSVKYQTYKNIEHIVVDGNSSDGTIDLLKKYASQDNRFWYISEPDKGMYDAINKGLSLAKGDIIAYLNTDDLYFPWAVEKVVKELSVPETDMILGDLCVIKKTIAGYSWFLQFYPEYDHDYYCFYSTIAQPTVFFKRKIYEKLGGFGNGFQLLADCDYWLRAYELGATIKKVDEVLALQIDHAQTLRETYHDLLRDEFIKLKELHNSKPIPTKINERIIRSYTSRRLKTAFYFSFFKQKNKAWSEFKAFIQDRGGSLKLSDLYNNFLPGMLTQHSTSPYGIDAEKILSSFSDNTFI